MPARAPHTRSCQSGSGRGAPLRGLACRAPSIVGAPLLCRTNPPASSLTAPPTPLRSLQLGPRVQRLLRRHRVRRHTAAALRARAGRALDDQRRVPRARGRRRVRVVWHRQRPRLLGRRGARARRGCRCGPVLGAVRGRGRRRVRRRGRAAVRLPARRRWVPCQSSSAAPQRCAPACVRLTERPFCPAPPPALPCKPPLRPDAPPPSPRVNDLAPRRRLIGVCRLRVRQLSIRRRRSEGHFRPRARL